MDQKRYRLAERRRAVGFSQEGLAEAIGVDRSTVARWERGETTPQPWQRRRLAEALKVTVEAASAMLVGGEPPSATEPADRAWELSSWLAQRSKSPVEQILAMVTEHATGFGRAAMRPLSHGRSDGSRAQTAELVLRYYGPWEGSSLEPYRVACNGERLRLSVVTRPEWTGLHVPLSTAAEQADLTASASGAPDMPFDSLLVSAAARRIGEIIAGETQMVDTVIYRLIDLRTTPSTMQVTLDTTTFLEYALTMDLLEGELASAENGTAGGGIRLPIRDRLLPDLAAVADARSRICVGGVVALFAVAREADHRRAQPDIALLVQQRSDRVLNAVGRLATIPKAFHEPLTDLRNDAPPSATLFREMEEELFGRVEVDSTDLQPRRQADPMHPTLLSEPMRWLTERRGTNTWRAECVGVGLNLISGNYELACLILIEDPLWWRLFGGMVEGNWEANGLRVYSSDDGDLLRTLMLDPTWSDEGLFAFAEGLRRLREITGSGPAGVVHG